MRTDEAQSVLLDWDRKGRYVFTKRDLSKLFNAASENTFNEMLKRLVSRGVLVRAAQGVYVFNGSSHKGPITIEDIALTLRRGEYVFESLESALSQWGDISQVPLDRMTCMTTGRKGEFRTPFGVIEFTHTDASPEEILENTVTRPGHPVPIATRTYALKNLKRTSRNRNMLHGKEMS